MTDTHEGTNPGTCSKPGCLGGHLPGRCTGHASDGSGRPCKRYPVNGVNVCPNHGASAPQVKSAAQMRILRAADDVAAALVKIALDGKEPTPARVAAARDLLDRAGLGAARMVDVTHRDLRDPAEMAAVTAQLEDELAVHRSRKRDAG
jgi:hypothetical protein